MRIIGQKVHDYYDSCMALGHDEGGNIFLREPKQIVLYPQEGRYYKERKAQEYGHLSFLTAGFHHDRCVELFDTDGNRWSLGSFRVLFAGKLYGGVSLSRDVFGTAKKNDYFYDWASLKDKLDKSNIKFDNDRRYGYSLAWDATLKDTLINHFITIDVMDKCVEHKLVIALIQPHRYGSEFATELNGELKKVQFYKLFDAFTAYQELAMFVDGTLASPGNVMVEVADKYRIAAHGFDERSFRKDPTKSRRK